MSDRDADELQLLLDRIRDQAVKGELRITRHALEEMVEESILLEEMLEALASAQVLEHYREHRRGACCLLSGVTRKGRFVHMVCTTTRPLLVVITAYEPKPPKWETPTRRRSQ